MRTRALVGENPGNPLPGSCRSIENAAACGAEFFYRQRSESPITQISYGVKAEGFPGPADPRFGATDKAIQGRAGRYEKSLGMLRGGAKGEKRSAYFIDFELKDSPNWAVIHDFRVELNGRVAQIDHLLINRLLETYVIESKAFRTKIRYENDGWERLSLKETWEGIESPIEQNERHIFVLKQLIDTHQLAPTRFGLKPNFINIVAVQGSCSIIGKRPRNAKIERIDTLIKKILKEDISVFGLLKVISQETLRALRSQPSQQVTKLGDGAPRKIVRFPPARPQNRFGCSAHPYWSDPCSQG